VVGEAGRRFGEAGREDGRDGGRPGSFVDEAGDDEAWYAGLRCFSSRLLMLLPWLLYLLWRP
jgi:hypothetical protein